MEGVERSQKGLTDRLPTTISSDWPNSY